ncbi:TPA: AEC family transporter [Pseudomonas aeruginosa]|nr:AEC family transporter [Pseudomonas aeruginosa]
MIDALLIVVPIFALILVGWLAGRFQVLGPYASAEINRFVVWLALPALMFDVIAAADWHALWQPRFIAVFALSAGISMAVALLVCWRRHGRLADAAIEALNSAYSNVGFVGFPIALLALGQASLVPATIASIITMCVIFAAAIALIEAGLRDDPHWLRLGLKVSGTLARNPILVASAAGAAWMSLGIGLPASAHTFFKLLGGAASPCALVALGLFLASRRAAETASASRHHGVTAFLVGCKLLLHPLLAWLLARFVFDLSPFMTQAVVLMAALPAGTGAFMLADYYRRDASTSSEVILVSTLLSVVSVALLLGIWG